ncbi:hypothetical protein Clacol_005182 [Clathrus columnatus]|uniref:Ricin B lectin domain-containing protein n=1 Tax=Clathrus columnatus TaxID=1419009 RepID=A0AAV5ABU6_9AGAM|nr:hypothetical protein Clacol_005182 [Clathrus columnatus]
MTEEVPTGVFHITNVAYPTQYVHIRSNKDGEDLVGWPAKGGAKQVNQCWLLKPLGNAAYHLVGFVRGGRGGPAKLAYVTPDRAPGVSLEVDLLSLGRLYLLFTCTDILGGETSSKLDDE